MSELVDAIRRKFKTPQAALKALGLDTTLLDDPGNRQRKRNSRMRQHLDEMISLLDTLGTDENPSMREEEETSMRSGKLDPRHHEGPGGIIIGGRERRGEDRFGLRRSSRDNLPRKVEEMPEQNTHSGEVRELLSQDDEDDELYDPLREHLRKTGMSEDDIEKACELAKDHVRRRRSNGRDRHADDFLPKNRLKGGPGGRFGGPRDSQHASGESDVSAAREYMRQIDQESERKAVDHFAVPNQDPDNAIIDHGMDRRRRGGRDRQAVDAIRGQLGRFGPDEAGCRPERPHEKGSTGSPSMASVARTTQRYPGLARIGDASTDGELGPWADKIGGF